MGKRTGIQMIRTSDNVRVMMFVSYGKEQCVTCHRTLITGEAYTKGVGPHGHNQSPYCYECVPFSAERVYIGEKKMLNISTTETVENTQKPLIYVKLATPGIQAIQDGVNEVFNRFNVTSSLQVAYLNDGYLPEDDHNHASHFVSMIIDPNREV